MYNKNFPKQVGGTGPAAYNRPPMKYRNVPSQVGSEAPNKFLGIGKAIKAGVGLIQGFADKDLKGKGFKARLGNSLKTGANALIGSDVFSTQNNSEQPGEAPAAEGNGEELAALKEQVEKNTYDLSTMGGAGSGLTRKGNMYGKDTDVKYSDNNPLKRTGCVKGYKK